MTEVQAGVFYPSSPLVVLSNDLLAPLRDAAQQSEWGRARFCAHTSPAASVQEMLIVQTAASYVRPHRHRGKDESLLLLEGELEAFIFDDSGGVRERFTMRSYAAGGPFFYRIGPLVWHSIVVTSPHIVMQEVTAGPFTSDDTEFARWSPPAADGPAIAAFLATLPRPNCAASFRPSDVISSSEHV